MREETLALRGEAIWTHVLLSTSLISCQRPLAPLPATTMLAPMSALPKISNALEIKLTSLSTFQTHMNVMSLLGSYVVTRPCLYPGLYCGKWFHQHLMVYKHLQTCMFTHRYCIFPHAFDSLPRKLEYRDVTSGWPTSHLPLPFPIQLA